jgi:hypothetical protein
MDNPYSMGYPFIMSLSPENKLEVLQQLDAELATLGVQRSLILCGGGALLVLDIIDRRTRDMDVITPQIDPVLDMAAKKVAQHFGLSEEWLNNGPASLARDLTVGWEQRAVVIYEGSCLEVKALGRGDLVASKMFAFCDREDDLIDLLKMRPTGEELDSIYDWVLARDASALWPNRVQDCFRRLRKALGHGE